MQFSFVLVLGTSYALSSVSAAETNPASRDAVAIVKIEPATNVVLAAAGEEQRAPLNKAVRAYYYYTCPVGGADERVFSWKASYHFGDHLLHMQGVKNIDSIDHITRNHQYFNTHWHHSTCIYGPEHVCFYAFRGYTFGSVGQDNLVMDLVTNSEDSDFAPMVWESCVEKHRMPKNFCSMSFMKRQSVACDLQDVDAFATD